MPDVSEIPEDSWPMLQGLDTWILDALRYKPHPTHTHVERSLEWIARAAPRRAVLTNLHIDLDHAVLTAETPQNVDVAYDGMVLEFPV
jgi:phosphoribosyl 1,2-cyclic phosphate phosphodiesterase